MYSEIISSPVTEDAPSYQAFMAAFREELEAADLEVMDDEERARHGFGMLNLRRSDRILRTWTLPETLREALTAVREPQTWMVLTEGWCGDSAQILPIVALAAAENERISLRVLRRDDHLDVMDRHLTNGTRGIPKLVVFNADGEEIASWGPRPSGAAQLVLELKSAGVAKDMLQEKLQLWYARDKGKEIAEELTALLRGVV